MGESIFIVFLTLLKDQDAGTLLDTSLLGVSCFAAVFSTLIILGIVLAALKDNGADKYYS